jgi:hypothetical protein
MQAMSATKSTLVHDLSAWRQHTQSSPIIGQFMPANLIAGASYNEIAIRDGKLP